MNPNTAKTLIVRNAFLCAAAIAITSCGTATFSKTGSDAQIESLRNFELAFIDEFAVPGKRFNAAAFDAKVNEGNAKFQQAIADEKFAARRPVLVDHKGHEQDLRSCPRPVRPNAGNRHGGNRSSSRHSVRSATNRSQRQRTNFR